MNTVNAPQVKPSMMFGDPAMDAVEWVTNNCYDDLRNAPQEPPFSEAEESLLPGEGGHNIGLDNVDVSFGSSGVIDGERVFIVIAEFAYRNDASRSMWGSPIALETHIKSTMEDQTVAIKKAFCNACPQLAEMGGTAAMAFREYMQSNDASTDDRHVLYLYLPIEQTMAKVQNETELVKLVQNLLMQNGPQLHRSKNGYWGC